MIAGCTVENCEPEELRRPRHIRARLAGYIRLRLCQEVVKCATQSCEARRPGRLDPVCESEPRAGHIGGSSYGCAVAESSLFSSISFFFFSSYCSGPTCNQLSTRHERCLDANTSVPSVHFFQPDLRCDRSLKIYCEPEPRDGIAVL
jgi:hypothetical protein